MQSGGNLTASAQNIDNLSGQIAARQTADISARNISNQEGRIDADRLNIKADGLDNRRGQIRSDGLTALQLSDRLANTNGLIGSAKDVRIHGSPSRNLHIDNTSGDILAGANLDIRAKSLRNNGTVAANQNAAIALKDSFGTERDIRAGSELILKTEGSLSNRHTLEGGRSVLLEADGIDNAASGKIQSGGHTQLNARNITNRGLINSNGLTLLEAGGSVHNTGSGRIYGDRVGIAADELVNREETVNGRTQSAAVAARAHLTIGAKDISNRESALLSSEGSLDIGGRLDPNHRAAGRAARIDNNGAQIQSQGDMHIAADTLLNRNSGYRSSHREVAGSRKQVTEYLMADRGYDFNEDHGLALYTEEDIRHRAGHGSIVLNNGQYHEDYTRTRYTQYDVETVVDSSKPGSIVSGGNLTLAGHNAVNDKSHILAAGTLRAPAGGISNLDDETAKSVTMKVGAVRDWHHVYYDWKSKKKDRFDGRAAPADTELVKTPGFRLRVFKTEGGLGGGGAVQSVPDVQLGGGFRIGGSAAAPVRTLDSAPALPVSSLYTVNPANPAYLVETDPAFADYRRWLGSDYMLKALDIDGTLHKRLGDGYYEQKLVNEQIARLTGYRRHHAAPSVEDDFVAGLVHGEPSYPFQYPLRFPKAWGAGAWFQKL